MDSTTLKELLKYDGAEFPKKEIKLPLQSVWEYLGYLEISLDCFKLAIQHLDADFFMITSQIGFFSKEKIEDFISNNGYQQCNEEICSFELFNKQIYYDGNLLYKLSCEDLMEKYLLEEHKQILGYDALNAPLKKNIIENGYYRIDEFPHIKNQKYKNDFFRFFTDKEIFQELYECAKSEKKELDYRQVISTTTQTHVLTVPRGESFKVVLCDGTEVWLNANSNFVYPTAFIGNERIVTLEGEAYFKVAKDAKHPFIVKTKTVQTRVLGTEFNIRSYTPEDTHVVLINGKVEVSNTKGGSYTRLYPGEDAHLQSDGNFVLTEVDLDSYVYWKDGYFYFDNITLKDIMQNLGRWYNVNIEFRNKEAMTYKMHFISDRTKDLEHTISLLNRMKKVTVTLQGNTLTID